MSNAHTAPTGHGSGRSLLTGSILAILLTILPFWLVMGGLLHDRLTTTILIFALAMVQIVVHVGCFLHVDRRSESGWTLLSFLFTAIIVGLTIIGSIWVMFHLNVNMMPMPMTGADAMQPMK